MKGDISVLKNSKLQEHDVTQQKQISSYEQGFPFVK